MKIKRRWLFVLCLFSLFFSLGWNIYQRENIKELQVKEQVAQNKIHKANAKVKHGKEALQTENPSKETEASINPSSQGPKKDFTQVVNKTFEGLYNFTPEDMTQRKEKVAPYLSDDLMKQYFSDRETYGDSDHVSSQLLEVQLYQNLEGSSTSNGLVVVQYESSLEDETPTKATNIFEVSYTEKDKKLTKIINLGNSYTSQLWED
ncbi:hypothetical protein [Tetragenococcus halophilus]|uniref:hypothetical protein n=1 Tax=Tetragenococcus halophilus TaxID=51669 RepID=UPI002564F052|nr:hypothetical protein [Tetragenococcus halophilus]GMG66728.1 hypothetical protein TEHIT2_19190 [Tetragenococcus halophilus]